MSVRTNYQEAEAQVAVRLHAVGYVESEVRIHCRSCRWLQGRYCTHPSVMTEVLPMQGCCNLWSNPGAFVA